MRALWVFATGLWGCYGPSPAPGGPCGPNGECPSALACVAGACVSPGSQPVDACEAPARCEGDMLVTCAGVQACAYGCESAEARCRALVPSNGLTPDLLDGATAVVDDESWHFDGVTGEIDDSDGDIHRAAGTGVIAGIRFEVIDGVGVFAAESFVLETDDWDFTGDNPIALYAATTIEIDGILDVGSQTSSGILGGQNGGSTGSNPTCRGRAGLAGAVGFGQGGGGGGGPTTVGGNGGASNGMAGGAGGVVCTTAPTTIPLRGGNGGGAGGWDAATSTVRGGNGGGGGGAIMLVAMEAIKIDGEIAAPGAGGISMTNGDGGGGGGGGGAILLEAPEVRITGVVTSNGGGGGAPSGTTGARGSVTGSGTAAGGTFMTVSGGRGGAGTTPPTNGGTYTNTAVPPTISRGGGGGGAVGRIHIRRRSGNDNGAILSPAAIIEDVVIQ